MLESSLVNSSDVAKPLRGACPGHVACFCEKAAACAECARSDGYAVLLRCVYSCLRLLQPLVSNLDMPHKVGLFDAVRRDRFTDCLVDRVNY